MFQAFNSNVQTFFIVEFIAKFMYRFYLWAQNLLNKTFQNEFYFGLVKVMTKFEKLYKTSLTNDTKLA